MTVLIDSDVLIEVSRGRNVQVVEQWEGSSGSEHLLLCSPVTVAELWHGAFPPEHETLRQLFAALICVPIDQDIGRRAGDYLRRYAKSHNLELADALIAATAVAQEAALWTRNRKHYPMTGLVFF